MPVVKDFASKKATAAPATRIAKEAAKQSGVSVKDHPLAAPPLHAAATAAAPRVASSAEAEMNRQFREYDPNAASSTTMPGQGQGLISEKRAVPIGSNDTIDLNERSKKNPKDANVENDMDEVFANLHAHVDQVFPNGGPNINAEGTDTPRLPPRDGDHISLPSTLSPPGTPPVQPKFVPNSTHSDRALLEYVCGHIQEIKRNQDVQHHSLNKKVQKNIIECRDLRTDVSSLKNTVESNEREAKARDDDFSRRIRALEIGSVARAASAPPGGRYNNMSPAALGENFFELKISGWPCEKRGSPNRTRFDVIQTFLEEMLAAVPQQVVVVHPRSMYPKFVLLRFGCFEDKQTFKKDFNSDPLPAGASLTLPTPLGRFPLKVSAQCPKHLAIPNREIRFCAWKIRELLGDKSKGEVFADLDERELCLKDLAICHFVREDDPSAFVGGLEGGIFCVNVSNIETACANLRVASIAGPLVNALKDKFKDLNMLQK